MSGIHFVTIFMMLPGMEAPSTQEPLQVRTAFVRVLESAEVPAADSGSLKSIGVRLGQAVKEGEELARLEDGEAQVAVQIADLENKIATREAATGYKVAVADAQVREAELQKQAAEVSKSIAEKQAQGDVTVQQATKTRDNLKKSRDRGATARAGNRRSLSEADLEKRQLDYELAELDLLKAKLDASVASLKADVENASVQQYTAAVDRLKQQAALEREKKQVSGISQQLKQNALQLAKLRLEKRRVVSPLNGEIVEIKRQRGEWVEPGTPVFRVIRLDRLRIEGYVKAKPKIRKLVGAAARIGDGTPDSATLAGKVTYVSPEVDSVNGEVLIHIEFDNLEQRFSPGQPVSVIVDSRAIR